MVRNNIPSTKRQKEWQAQQYVNDPIKTELIELMRGGKAFDD